MEDRRLVSGWNCTPQSVYDEMRLTKEQFDKTDGRQYYHFVQSFDKRMTCPHRRFTLWGWNWPSVSFLTSRYWWHPCGHRSFPQSPGGEQCELPGR